MSSTDLGLWAMQVNEEDQPAVPVVQPKVQQPAKPDTKDWLQNDLLVSGAAIMGVILVAVVILTRLESWKRRQLRNDLDETDSSMSYRTMLEAGELSKEEYDRIMQRIGQRAKGKLVPPPMTPQAPPKDSEPPQPNQ
jgi:hypothetical protein